MPDRELSAVGVEGATGSGFFPDGFAGVIDFQHFVGSHGGDKRIAVGQPGSVAGALDRAFPHGFAGGVDFDDLVVRHRGDQVAITGQSFNTAPVMLGVDRDSFQFFAFIIELKNGILRGNAKDVAVA